MTPNHDGLEQTNFNLDVYFMDLDFNEKKQIYNYHSGMISGMILSNLVYLRHALQSKKDEDKQVSEKLISQIIPMASRLVNDYNWKLGDFNILTQRYIGGKSQQ